MDLGAVIAENCRRHRAHRGLSQAALAERAGLSKQTVVDIEVGRANPRLETLDLLAGALQVSVRALITEMGHEVLYQPIEVAQWHDQGPFIVRQLDQVYGSGYVNNAVLRLHADRGVIKTGTGTRGMLRHCYVLEGQVKLGPEDRTVEAGPGDFIRFPAEQVGIFHALTEQALVFVVTTTPQLSMRGPTISI